MGNLQDISVDSRGVITGYFTNGVNQTLAQIALASFNNPTGLLRAGNNMYGESANSGGAIIGFSGTSNQSTITPGALESSNVDLSEEFTNMIIAQRGFQANARVITTADEMLHGAGEPEAVDRNGLQARRVVATRSWCWPRQGRSGCSGPCAISHPGSAARLSPAPGNSGPRARQILPAPGRPVAEADFHLLLRQALSPTDDGGTRVAFLLPGDPPIR